LAWVEKVLSGVLKSKQVTESARPLGHGSTAWIGTGSVHSSIGWIVWFGFWKIGFKFFFIWRWWSPCMMVFQVQPWQHHGWFLHCTCFYGQACCTHHQELL